jgi:hypothetical protein
LPGVHRAVYTVGVDENQAREILKSLRQEADEAQQAVVNAQVRVAALGKLIEGYCELFPGLAKDVRRIAVEQAEATDAVPDRPTGQEAVLRVLSDITYRGRYWSPSMMVDELEGRGWSPRSDNPVNAVRTALTRLAESDARVLKGRGEHGIVYYFAGEGAPTPNFRGESLSLAPGGVDPDSFRFGGPGVTIAEGVSTS